ncbi:MAG: hypothetical protein NVSMB31_14900 [Vulcanimicrobiaceae bacterium]
MRIHLRSTLLAIGLVMAVMFTMASGIAGATQPKPPPCSAPEYRQFDFFAGSWNVYSASDHKLLGTNTVTPEFAPCILQEHWKGVDGLLGTSFNMYDAARKLWHQSWVDNTGGFQVMDGAFTDGKMILAGTAITRTGKAANQRVVYAPRTDGTLRQTWSMSLDGGKTWKTVFDAIYEKKSG